ncbi:MAG: hypothetical protein PWQ58_769 [Archaeoglobaceae archaeon]|nr:hypothetical protein [Archaeoglobaceae archaeon]
MKKLAGALLIAFGVITSFKGAMDADEKILNLGVGSIFLGLIFLAFSGRKESLDFVLSPYISLFRKISNSLKLSNAIYIPPCVSLPNGGVFVPLHEDFDLDLGKIDDETVFITDVGREKELGILLPSFGSELLKAYEDYSEINFAGAGISVVDYASSVLRSLNLARSVTAEEDGNFLKIKVEGMKVKDCSRECEIFACPICASILLSVAKGSGELLAVRRFDVGERIEIVAEKIGGVDRWM